VRLLPSIRFGTERYPEKVARRLRVLNIATWSMTAPHAFWALVLFFDSTTRWHSIPNVVFALLFAGVPLLHRLSPLAGPVPGIFILYVDLFVLI